MRFWIRYGWILLLIGGVLLWSMLARLTRPPQVTIIASPEAMGHYYIGDQIEPFDGLAQQFQLSFEAKEVTTAMIEVEGLSLNGPAWCQIWVDGALVKEKRHENGQAIVRCEYQVKP